MSSKKKKVHRFIIDNLKISADEYNSDEEDSD